MAKGKILAAVIVICLLTVLISGFSGAVLGFLAGRIPEMSENTENKPIPKTDRATDPGQSSDVIGVAQACIKSVVSITITQEIKGYNGGSSYSSVATAHGTGVIIREDGYIVTCWHVVEGADSISVMLQDESKHDAQLVGKDERFDLAVIRIPADGLPAAQPGDSDIMMAGEGVIVIGNPLGEFGFSVSAGILSAPTRDLSIEGTPLRLMQTDAAINPGNSGGGLFNMAGELIGIVNAKVSASGIEGIGFAIPMNTISEEVDALISKGVISEKAILGVSVKKATVFENGKEIKCVEITSLRSNGPAETAGLKVGDYILSINNKTVTDQESVTLEIKYRKPGETVPIEIFRDQKRTTVSVVLGST